MNLPNYIKAKLYKTRSSNSVRDGVKLFTAIYEPKTNRKISDFANRTPYTVQPYGADKFKTLLGPGMNFC